MLDFGRCSEEQLGAVREVVQALVDTASIDPQNLLLVAAWARDKIHILLESSDRQTVMLKVDFRSLVCHCVDCHAAQPLVNIGPELVRRADALVVLTRHDSHHPARL